MKKIILKYVILLLKILQPKEQIIKKNIQTTEIRWYQNLVKNEVYHKEITVLARNKYLSNLLDEIEIDLYIKCSRLTGELLLKAQAGVEVIQYIRKKINDSAEILNWLSRQKKEQDEMNKHVNSETGEYEYDPVEQPGL